jgi:KaiC/GvpD/RAD55 family RecA-like ATPase
MDVKFSNAMTQKIQLVPSGIPLVDLTWRGLYRGGSYFLIGPRKSGKTILALQFAMKCAEQNEVCLFFTSIRPKDLMILAASIDFDLQHYMNQNLIIVVRVTPPEDLEEVENPDEYLAEYISDIVPVVNQYNPSKLIFDSLTQFVNIKDSKLLRKTFLKSIEDIEDTGITSLFTLSEPANPVAKGIVDLLTELATGVIHLEKQSYVLNKENPGLMTINPNLGHSEGKFSANYFIEPNKGVTVDYLPTKEEVENESSDIIRESEDDKYKLISEIEEPEITLDLSDEYTFEEFELIINNQIALYQLTGKIFRLISIRLDESPAQQKLITLNQLRNAVRLSADKKDKICTVGNKILILFLHDTVNAVPELVAKIRSNLVNDDKNLVRAMSDVISIYSIVVDEEIKDAKAMISSILNNESTNLEKSHHS